MKQYRTQTQLNSQAGKLDPRSPELDEDDIISAIAEILEQFIKDKEAD